MYADSMSENRNNWIGNSIAVLLQNIADSMNAIPIHLGWWFEPEICEQTF